MGKRRGENNDGGVGGRGSTQDKRRNHDGGGAAAASGQQTLPAGHTKLLRRPADLEGTRRLLPIMEVKETLLVSNIDHADSLSEHDGSAHCILLPVCVMVHNSNSTGHLLRFLYKKKAQSTYNMSSGAVLPCCRVAVLPCCRVAVLPCLLVRDSTFAYTIIYS